MVFPKAAWHTIGRTKVVTEFSFVTFSDPSEKVYVMSGDLDGDWILAAGREMLIFPLILAQLGCFALTK